MVARDVGLVAGDGMGWLLEMGWVGCWRWDGGCGRSHGLVAGDVLGSLLELVKDVSKIEPSCGRA